MRKQMVYYHLLFEAQATLLAILKPLIIKLKVVGMASKVADHTLSRELRWTSNHKEAPNNLVASSNSQSCNRLGENWLPNQVMIRGRKIIRNQSIFINRNGK